MLRTHIVATAVLAGLTFAAVPADAQMLRPQGSPAALTKSEHTPKPRFEQKHVPVGQGRWGASTPLGRPCYAGMLAEPCSTPGPSISIEVPGFRIKK